MRLLDMYLALSSHERRMSLGMIAALAKTGAEDEEG
jgi:hypothetical protein